MKGSLHCPLHWRVDVWPTVWQCSLQLTPAHSSSLQLTPAHSSSLQFTPAHYSSLQLTPVNSSSLQLTPAHSSSRQLTPVHSQMHTSKPVLVKFMFQENTRWGVLPMLWVREYCPLNHSVCTAYCIPCKFVGFYK
jgi:hypothetical protein